MTATGTRHNVMGTGTSHKVMGTGTGRRGPGYKCGECGGRRKTREEMLLHQARDHYAAQIHNTEHKVRGTLGQLLRGKGVLCRLSIFSLNSSGLYFTSNSIPPSPHVLGNYIFPPQ